MLLYIFFLLNSQSIGLGLINIINISKSNDSNLGWKNAMRTSLIHSIFQNKQIDTSTDLLCLSAMNEDQNKKQNQKTTLIGIFNML